MKKILFIISICFITLCTFPMATFASDIPIENHNACRIIETNSRTVTKAEAISIMMDKTGMSYDEAKQKYSDAVTRGTSTQERWITYDAGMGYVIEVGCLVTVQCGSGHCNFGEIINTWSEATGSGSYSWNSFYEDATITGNLRDSIHFMSRGALEVTADTSASIGFEAAGFSISSSIGSTTTYRKTISINQTWRPGI